MFEILKNPKTENYFLLKETVLSNNLPWFYCDKSILDAKELDDLKYENAEFFHHCVLERPNSTCLYPSVISETAGFVNNVLSEIFTYNKIDVSCIFRINFNCMYYTSNKRTIPHLDHNFPHKNLLVYLNSFDNGETVIFGEDEKEYLHKPKEDDIIAFGGNIHCCQHPSPGQRRIVLVTTYI